MLNGDEVLNRRPSKKLFLKKTSKSFGSSKISLTFASAFAKKATKKSSLKDLDINKQVVQDCLQTEREISNETETVNTYFK